MVIHQGKLFLDPFEKNNKSDNSMFDAGLTLAGRFDRLKGTLRPIDRNFK